MAVVNKTIGAAGDYTTAAGWEAAIPADQAQGDPWHGEVIDAANMGAMTVNVSNANAAPHRIWGDASVRFTTSTDWTTAGGAKDLDAMAAGLDFACLCGAFGGSTAIDCSTSDFVVQYLWVSNTSASSGRSVYARSGGIRMNVGYCIVSRPSATSDSPIRVADDDFTIHNSIIFEAVQGDGILVEGGNDNLVIVHVTRIEATEYNSTNTATHTIDNSIAVEPSAPNHIDHLDNWTGDWNVSDGPSSKNEGANSWSSQTPTDVLVSPTGSARDPTPVDTTYVGADLSGTSPTDIEGTTRTQFLAGAIDTEVAAVGGRIASLVGSGGLAGGGSALVGAGGGMIG